MKRKLIVLFVEKKKKDFFQMAFEGPGGWGQSPRQPMKRRRWWSILGSRNIRYG